MREFKYTYDSLLHFENAKIGCAKFANDNYNRAIEKTKYIIYLT